MTKRISSLLVAVAIIFSLAVPCTFAEEQQTVLYVSTTGNDENSGTIESPLKTLAGARDRVRELRKTGVDVSEVIFRGGEYRMRKTEFSLADSGTDEVPVVYRAYDGEKVQFKGSVELDISKMQPVTDEIILSRMYEKVRDRVVMIDLAAQGLSQGDICDTSIVNSLQQLTDNGGYNGIYVNGVACQLAQWPNGREYVRWSGTYGPTSIRYEQSNPERWTNAKNWWIGCFPDYDYDYMTVSAVGVDTEKRSIEVIPNVVIGLTNPGSRRWKAFNLLEEIDIPGEFYIDRDEMILYLYPPHTLKDAKVEMDIEYSSLISVVEASNITFRDITFTQSRGDAVSMKNVRNIDFLRCQFRDIDQYGIRATGTEIPVTGASYWQIGYVKNNASYDVDIKDCTFDNLGGVGIYLLGGNVDELIPSGNVVENNIFSRTNQRYFFNGCMFISGCGNTVRQNDISHIPFHAITFSGNDHLIELNEIYDAVRESGDAGAIYQGRNQLYRGTSILKNYFHGIVNGDPLLFSHTRCIYMDDAQHGNIIENNIMVGGQEGYNCMEILKPKRI